ncbi:LADA_0G14554g1_1 [Lachancea dasiensis]|uniref:Thiamine pyrophosphokinase n=1 Tax=Lachancea dasiensis TaxID=1072105 RepID=A0A1G4JW30_9SACH|nr:LADA_0G14554g1_1 [Lachancea dasiensis]
MPSTEEVIENTESIAFEEPASSHVFNLDGFLSPDGQSSALLILNQQILIAGVFEKLWRNYHLHVCADGGANRLYEYFEGKEESRLSFIPNYIIGDMDSIRDEVLHFYLEHGAIVVSQSWQNSTDFMKSLQLIFLHFHYPELQRMLKTNDFAHNYGIDDCHGIETMYNKERASCTMHDIDLLVLNAIDGRFDQTVHSISQLYSASKTDPYYRMYFLTATDLIMLIPTGGALIRYSKEFKANCIKNCGLLPLGGPTTINRTKGLKWDVLNWKTSIFDGKVSSNNRFSGETCCFFDVQDPIVLSIEVVLSKISSFI